MTTNEVIECLSKFNEKLPTQRTFERFAKDRCPKKDTTKTHDYIFTDIDVFAFCIKYDLRYCNSEETVIFEEKAIQNTGVHDKAIAVALDRLYAATTQNGWVTLEQYFNRKPTAKELAKIESSNIEIANQYNNITYHINGAFVYRKDTLDLLFKGEEK